MRRLFSIIIRQYTNPRWLASHCVCLPNMSLTIISCMSCMCLTLTKQQPVVLEMNVVNYQQACVGHCQQKCYILHWLLVLPCPKPGCSVEHYICQNHAETLHAQAWRDMRHTIQQFHLGHLGTPKLCIAFLKRCLCHVMSTISCLPGIVLCWSWHSLD